MSDESVNQKVSDTDVSGEMTVNVTERVNSPKKRKKKVLRDETRI